MCQQSGYFIHLFGPILLVNETKVQYGAMANSARRIRVTLHQPVVGIQVVIIVAKGESKIHQWQSSFLYRYPPTPLVSLQNPQTLNPANI